jgi:hypothetical protein
LNFSHLSLFLSLSFSKINYKGDNPCDILF